MSRVPIARAAFAFAVVALVVNVAVLLVALTDAERGLDDATSLLRWLAPLARPAADIGIILGFLSLLTERIGDAYPRQARHAVLVGLVAIVLGAVAAAFG